MEATDEEATVSATNGADDDGLTAAGGGSTGTPPNCVVCATGILKCDFQFVDTKEDMHCALNSSSILHRVLSSMGNAFATFEWGVGNLRKCGMRKIICGMNSAEVGCGTVGNMRNDRRRQVILRETAVLQYYKPK